MIKVQQGGCPVSFNTKNDGFLLEADSQFMGMQSWMHRIWLPAWTPEQLRYIADTLEEAQKNGGKLVMEIKK
jgi:hypothetical protein